MYISRRIVTVAYKLIVGTLALGLGWYYLGVNGLDALRLFPTWILFLTAIYYISSALILALNAKRNPRHNYCPMLEGMIIMGYFLMSGLALASATYGFRLPELPVWLIVLLCVLLPVLTFLDWAIFAQKGRWRPMGPFYWCALPVCYAATMIFTAELMPRDEAMRYPLEILDFANFGLFEMVGWMLVVLILDLSVGYILFLADFALSGKLARKIVLPHIRTVVIEDDMPKATTPTASNDAGAHSKTKSANTFTATKPKTSASSASKNTSKNISKNTKAKTPKPKSAPQKSANPKVNQKAKNSTSNKPTSDQKKAPSKANHKTTVSTEEQKKSPAEAEDWSESEQS